MYKGEEMSKLDKLKELLKSYQKELLNLSIRINTIGNFIDGCKKFIKKEE